MLKEESGQHVLISKFKSNMVDFKLDRQTTTHNNKTHYVWKNWPDSKRLSELWYEIFANSFTLKENLGKGTLICLNNQRNRCYEKYWSPVKGEHFSKLGTLRWSARHLLYRRCTIMKNRSQVRVSCSRLTLIKCITDIWSYLVVRDVIFSNPKF